MRPARRDGRHFHLRIRCRYSWRCRCVEAESFPALLAKHRICVAERCAGGTPIYPRWGKRFGVALRGGLLVIALHGWYRSGSVEGRHWTRRDVSVACVNVCPLAVCERFGYTLCTHLLYSLSAGAVAPLIRADCVECFTDVQTYRVVGVGHLPASRNLYVPRR